MPGWMDRWMDGWMDGREEREEGLGRERGSREKVGRMDVVRYGWMLVAVAVLVPVVVVRGTVDTDRTSVGQKSIQRASLQDAGICIRIRIRQLSFSPSLSRFARFHTSLLVGDDKTARGALGRAGRRLERALYLRSIHTSLVLTKVTCMYHLVYRRFMSFFLPLSSPQPSGVCVSTVRSGTYIMSSSTYNGCFLQSSPGMWRGGGIPHRAHP